MSTASPLIGNGTGLEIYLGLEEVERATMKILSEGLNDAIERRNDMFDDPDIAMAEIIDADIAQVDMQVFEKKNFHQGPHRSLLDSGIDIFPAICVMAYHAQPSPSDRVDQAHAPTIRLFVETLVSTGPVADNTDVVHETIVHRRCTRTTEAVCALIMRNPYLCGTAVPGISTLPRADIMNQSFVRRENEGTGPRYLWQGSRLEFTVQRHSMP